MNNTKYLLGIIAIVVVVIALAGGAMSVSNAVNPKSSAQATSIELAAQQQALDAEQARQQQQAEWAVEQAQREKISSAWVSLRTTYIKFLTWYLVILSAAATVSIGVGGSYAIFRASTGLAEAFRIFAINRASTIYPDKETGLYPIVIRNPSGKDGAEGWVANTQFGQVMALDKPKEPDIRQVVATTQVQAFGVVSRNAAQARGSGPEVIAAAKPQVDVSGLFPAGQSAPVLETRSTQPVKKYVARYRNSHLKK